MTVKADGKTLATNSTARSIAKNYVKAYSHNTNSATVDGSSYFQNMYVFFTAPKSGDVTLTLSHKGEGDAYFDDVRVVENGYDGIEFDEDGNVTKLTNDFENNAQGIWPFVISGSEGVEDNRIHLSEMHAPYTQAGWDVKKMDDVLDGKWSVKVNGLTQKGTLVYQTIPQNIEFEAGQKYKVSFDYQSGSDGIYAVAVGQGEFSAGSVDLTNLDKALGTDGHYEFELTGGVNNDSWFGIYSTSVTPDLQESTGSAQDFGGYKDFVLDNLVIERVNETKTQAEAQSKYDEVADKYDGTQIDYSDAVWQTYQETLAQAKALINKNSADTEDFAQAYNLLAWLDEYMQSSVLDPAANDKQDVAKEAYVVSAGSAQPQSGSEGPVDFANDGNTSTYWHTQWGVDAISAGTAWYQFDLNEPTTITGLRYLPRPNSDPANGKILDYEITVTTAEGAKAALDPVTGTFKTTGWQKVDLGKIENVLSVRLTAKSSTGQTDNQANQFASAAELRLTTDRDVPPAEITVDKADLTDLVEDAKALVQADYTEESWAEFAKQLAAAEKVLADENATLYDVALATANLQTAIKGLKKAEIVVADKSALQSQVNEAKKLDEKAYTAESWAAFKTALAAAQQVLDNPKASQAEVDDALDALQTAIVGLKETGGDPGPKPEEPEMVDKSALNAAIAKAEAIDLSGYTNSSAKAVRAALERAKAVAADENATQEQVDAALKALQTALDQLEKQSGKPVNPGDDKPSVDKPKQPGVADTGANVAAIAAIGVALVFVGVGLVVFRRRNM